MQNDHDLETAPDGVTRRDLFRLGNALTMPMLFGAAGAGTAAAAAAGPLEPGARIYQSIGVEPVIN